MKETLNFPLTYGIELSKSLPSTSKSIVSNADLSTTPVSTASTLAILKANVSKNGIDDQDAFFVANLSSVVSQYKKWIALLPRVTPHYAVKCNPDPTVIKTLAQCGASFDCASKAEIQLVLDAGVDSSRIIYANPCKQSSHIKFASNNHVKVMTFDNADELHKISAIAPETKMVLRILTDDSKSVCRFGVKFGASLSIVPLLLQTAKDLKIDVIGISFHVGSGCFDASSFGDAVVRARKAFDIGTALGFDFSILDIGGGFPGASPVGLQFEEIASLIGPMIDDLFPQNVRVISEPGRFFVSAAYTLAVNICSRRVVARDVMDGDEKGAVSSGNDHPTFMYYINDGMYGSFNCITFDHAHPQPKVLKRDGKFLFGEPVAFDSGYQCSIWGPTCDSIDLIGKDFVLPELKIGDWLVFEQMGAYTMAAASTFNGFKKTIINAPTDDFDLFLAKFQDMTDYDEDADYGTSKAAVIAERTSKSSTMKSNKAADAKKRYAFLLGQTDIFSHFINVAKMKAVDKSQFADFTLNDQKDSGTGVKKGGAGRTRKTEKEEDEEMLQKADAELEEENAFSFSESPDYIKNGTMRDYQIQGLNWLISLYENGINGILADEMGLGKTLQTISFLGFLKHFEDVKDPHLIIVPKSTLHNWVSEIKKWCPTLRPFLFHGSKEERAELVKNDLFSGKWDVCVTSYEMCLIEKAQLKKISWAYMVIDEAHRIKNENSLLSQIVRMIECRNRLLITGTPLQNDLHELWALLNFLLPDIFSSSADFDSWFKNEQGEDQDLVVKQLHKVLGPFLLRRIKSDVEKSLLPKKRIDLYVGMSSMQRKWYKKLLEKDISALNGAIKKSGSAKRLQNIVMQLRKCCNHPYLFDGAEEGPPYTTDQHIVDNAGKMAILDKLLLKLKSQDSRVLIFCQMSRMVDILEDYCNWKGYKYCRLDGQTAHVDRISMIDEFNREGSEKFIFLLTTRAGGLGINLATADTVVMYDNDWNPQVDLQAEDRAHRIGQKKQVVIFRFITENAIEEKVIDRATQKLRLDQLVIQQGRQAVTKANVKDDLVSMIQYGADNIFQSTDSTIDTDDFERILARSETKSKELQQKYKDMGLDDLQQFTSEQQGGFNAYQWEGQDFKAKAGGINWIGPGKRERSGKYDSLNFTQGRGPSSGAFAGLPAKKEKAPKPKAINISDFQFYPLRLHILQEKEKYYFWKENSVQLNPNDCPLPIEQFDDWLAKEQKLIDEAVPLTEEEIAEKERLGTQGFENWAKRDFNNFLKGQEKFGKKNLEAIAAEIDGKTLEEVTLYSKVFWERFAELGDNDKIISNIEKAEARLVKITEINNAIDQKVAACRVPLQQVKLVYGPNKGKAYTEEEDRFLLVMLQKYKYGTDDIYEKIRIEIKKSPLFRFDWFLKSRSTSEINRRCQTLVMLIEKEHGIGPGEYRKRKEIDDAAGIKIAKKKK